MEQQSVVVVTLAIITGPHAALGTERRVLFFDTYPGTEDIKAAVVEDIKFSELVMACEEDEVGEYISDWNESEQFISFECHDDDGNHIGSIVIEQHPVITTSMVTI